ncbi:hypothetical protein [Nocardia sp. NPDC024068]|uniref:hypothetical protein n=1 Tax=Nocardia sp. NPDC024068 TaxID=3157197 RepID=UPI0033CC7F3B
MTDTNPPEGDRAEQTKWWETPGAGGSDPARPQSGGPVPDATMINPNAGPAFPSDQHGQPYSSGQQQYPSGQQHSGGQQYASGQQPHSGGQQYPSGQQFPSGQQSHPSGQQSHPSGQQSHPGGQQSPAPGQAPGGQWPGPQPGFPAPTGYPRSRSRSNNTALIVVGVVLLVVVLVCGGGIALLNAGGDEKDKEWAGDYGMASVTNSCDLIDAGVLDQWAATRDETTHQESPPADYGGGSLNCRISNEGTDTNSARLTLDVAFTGEYTTYGYDDWKKTDTATTGTDYDSGSVSGLGQEAYYASHVSDYSSFETVDYSVAAKDSNVSVKVTMYISYDGPVDTSTVDQLCRDQVRKVLDGLRE